MRCAVVDWKKEYFGLFKEGIDSHFYELFEKKLGIWAKIMRNSCNGPPDHLGVTKLSFVA